MLVVWGTLSLLSVCHFVILLVRLRISQRRKKIGASNFACVLAYNPDRSSPLLVNFGSRESRGRRHYCQDERLRRLLCVGAWHGHSELGQRRCLRPYGGICVLQAY